MISTLLPMLSFSEINGTRPGLSVAALNRAHIHMTEHKIYTAKKGAKKRCLINNFHSVMKDSKEKIFWYHECDGQNFHNLKKKMIIVHIYNNIVLMQINIYLYKY